MGKMQDFQKEVTRISTLFPQVGIDVIFDFMRNIPEISYDLRVPITLSHFYELEDSQNTSILERENLQHTELIHDLFPVYSKRKIMKSLKKYGNLQDRCKRVLRNIVKHFKPVNAIPSTFGNISGEQVKITHSAVFDNEVQEHNEPKNNVLQDRLIDEEKGCETTSAITEAELPGDFDKSFSHQEHNSLENLQISKLEEPDPSYMAEEIIPELPQQEIQEPEITYYPDQVSLSFEEIFIPLQTETENLAGPNEVIPLKVDRVFVFPERNQTVVSSSKNYQSATTTAYMSDTVPSNVDPKPVEIITIEDIAADVSIRKATKSRKVLKKPLQGYVDLHEGVEPLKKKHKMDHRNGDKNKGEFNLINYLAGITSKPSRKVKDYCEMLGINLHKRPSEETMDNLIYQCLHGLDEDSDTDDYFGDALSNESENSEGRAPPSSPSADIIEQIDMTFEAPQTLKAEETNSKAHDNVVYRLIEIFPEADQKYIRKLLNAIQNKAVIPDNQLIDLMIERMLDGDYPKRVQRAPSPEKEVDVEKQIAFIQELLPNADPNYLSMKVNELNSEQLKDFIADALEKHDYPTLKESLRDQQLSAQMRQYTTEFSVEKFVKLVPDPQTTFGDPKRFLILQNYDTNYVGGYFRNKFDKISLKYIQKELTLTKYQPYKCYINLKNNPPPTMKSRRAQVHVRSTGCQNIPLLQELAYVDHEEEILQYVSILKEQKERERLQAKESGQMLVCSCCFDDEVMPNETYSCNANCIFCKQCVIKSTEVAFGEGRLDYPCLGDCGSYFSLQTLQQILPPKLFSKIAQKKAIAEVKAAGIADLEYCPFCDFATIPSGPPEVNKIFSCQNPECLKESCRLCKEPSHVPLRCEEVEKDEDVKKRVFIENRMTEALLRKCWKCGISFFKDEGCNKMTCSCGAHMCYICGKPVTDYKHFNGIGGDQFHLCPLYSDNVAINKQNVLEGAKAAKKEVGVAGSSDLKIDPTADVEKHYENLKKKLPKEGHLHHLHLYNRRAQAGGEQHNQIRVLPAAAINGAAGAHPEVHVWLNYPQHLRPYHAPIPPADIHRNRDDIHRNRDDIHRNRDDIHRNREDIHRNREDIRREVDLLRNRHNQPCRCHQCHRR